MVYRPSRVLRPGGHAHDVFIYKMCKQYKHISIPHCMIRTIRTNPYRNNGRKKKQSSTNAGDSV